MLRNESRSARLRKYGTVYKKYMKKYKNLPVTKSKVQTRRTRNPYHKKNNNIHQLFSPKKKKKTLNNYQRFVKKESRKDKYKNMRGSQRLAFIAVEWESHKKKLNKRGYRKTRGQKLRS